MEDLNGIDFSIGARPVPDLIPFNRTQMSHAAHARPGLSKGDVVIYTTVLIPNIPNDFFCFSIFAYPNLFPLEKKYDDESHFEKKKFFVSFPY